MKNTKIIFPKLFLLFLCFSSAAQPELDQTKLQDNAICILPGGPFEGFLYVPPAYNNLLQPAEKNLTISADYVPNNGTITFGPQSFNCTTWPLNAQTAFDHALGLWAPYLDSDHPITVRACWSEDLGGSTLGSAGAAGLNINTGVANCWFHAPLAESIFNNPAIYANWEINAIFNADLGAWYFGTDGSPGMAQFDFVTVVMHEVGHGLGFAGLEDYDDGMDDIECNNIAGHGCLGSQIDGIGPLYLSAYSKTIQTDDGTSIGSITSPSANLGTLFTGGSLSGGGGGLFLSGANVLAENSNNPAQLYTPSPFEPGSSYSHFDDILFPNELMIPVLNSGQAIHTPGLAFHHLRDMGWTTSFLPVELVRFEADAKETNVQLSWETATELNNQGFELERSADAQKWTSIGFVAGKGNSMEPSFYQFMDKKPSNGVNYYRLVQVDWDGTQSESNIVHVLIKKGENQLSVFPNPIGTEAFLASTNSDQLPLAYQIVNAVGSLVSQGLIDTDHFPIETTNWPNGVYTLLTENGQQIRMVK